MKINKNILVCRKAWLRTRAWKRIRNNKLTRQRIVQLSNTLSGRNEHLNQFDRSWQLCWPLSCSEEATKSINSSHQVHISIRAKCAKYALPASQSMTGEIICAFPFLSSPIILFDYRQATKVLQGSAIVLRVTCCSQAPRAVHSAVCRERKQFSSASHSRARVEGGADKDASKHQEFYLLSDSLISVWYRIKANNCANTLKHGRRRRWLDIDMGMQTMILWSFSDRTMEKARLFRR